MSVKTNLGKNSNFAIVFDMDGVLVDSELHWKKVESSFLQGLVKSWVDADQRRIIGMSAYDVHRLLVSEYGLSITAKDFFAYYDSLARDLYGSKVSLLPGVSELIERIAIAKIPLAVASSSTHAWIDIVLERFLLKKHFSVVVSSDDFGGVGKPAPDIYLRTAELLRCSPGVCVAIEDSHKGVTSAKTAGMKVIGFRNGFNDHQDLSEVDHVCSSFAELDIRNFASLICK